MVLRQARKAKYVKKNAEQIPERPTRPNPYDRAGRRPAQVINAAPPDAHTARCGLSPTAGSHLLHRMLIEHGR